MDIIQNSIESLVIFQTFDLDFVFVVDILCQ